MNDIVQIVTDLRDTWIRPEPPQPEEETGFFTDTTICIGCKACEVACKQWNQLPADGFNWTGNSYDNTVALSDTTWRHVAFVEQFDAESHVGRWLMMSDVCKHCQHAPCVEVCPTGALIYNEFGNVYVQQDVCNGCANCVVGCPFGVISRNKEDGRAHKCTLCYDRQKDGLEPACAKSCPTESIKFGKVSELREHAKKRVEELHARGETDAYLYGAEASGEYSALNSFFLLKDNAAVYNLPERPRRGAAHLKRNYLFSFAASLALPRSPSFSSKERIVAEIEEINDPRDVFSKLTPAYDIQRAATPDRVKEPGYYGLPILKRPFWGWEIALYFFFEGVSAGTYVLCSVAGLRDKERFGGIIRRGRYLSFATMLLCPPLLIADLGRPERFHHMLRIFKKTSPMNHGAWALSGYGIFASVLAALAWPASKLPFGVLRLLMRAFQWLMPERLLALFGMPFALTMISYPGVLLETTANPLWSHTNFLGPLFASSSLSNGAAALTLLSYNSEDHALHSAIARFEDFSSAAEATSLALYVGSAGQAAKPLFRGKQSKLFLLGAIGLGLIAPAILRRSRSKVVRHGVAPLLTLLGGAALKWSITNAGQESALDAELASKNAPSRTGEPFWGPAKPSTSYPPPR